MCEKCKTFDNSNNSISDLILGIIIQMILEFKLLELQMY